MYIILCYIFRINSDSKMKQIKDLFISPNDVFDFLIDEVVERVDVLPDETFDLQKGRNQFPLFRNLFDGSWHLARVHAQLAGNIRPA